MAAFAAAAGAANSVRLDGDRGTLYVDAQMSEPSARELLSFAPRPPRYLLETHPHGDHTFGAAAFPESCVVIAERQAEAWADGCWSRGGPDAVARLFFGDRIAEAVGSNEPWAAHLARRLGEPVFASVRRRRADLLWQGGFVLRLGPPVGDIEVLSLGAAHSAADCAVWIPTGRVLIAGDLVFSGRPPFVSDPTLPAWLGALDRLASLRPAVVVPGHGPHGGPELLDGMRGQIERLAASPDPVRQAVENALGAGRRN